MPTESGSLGGGECDGVAEGAKLPGQLVGAPGAVQPPGVEVGAEVGELRGGVGEQLEDDDQDRDRSIAASALALGMRLTSRR